ncbi:MAG: hypothetical protein WDM86_08810 [Rhizomicrobium sp.]
MNGNHSKSWLRLLAPIGVYLLFLLQFLVPAEYTSELFTHVLSAHYFDTRQMPSNDKNFWVAVVFFFPYVLCAWIFQNVFVAAYGRLTMNDRLESFDTAIGKIARYCDRHPIADILTRLNAGSADSAGQESLRVVLVMIDLMITDLRDAFQDLCAHPDIRVSIYMESAQEINYKQSPETVLHMMATTVFEKEYEMATRFRRTGPDKRYEGFCGAAFDGGGAVCGTYRKFGFVHDPRFSLGNGETANVLEKTRSFLCLPIAKSSARGAPVRAVLAIDSGRRYDFVLTRDTRDLLSLKLTPIKTRLSGYLDALKNQLEYIGSVG